MMNEKTLTNLAVRYMNNMMEDTDFNIADFYEFTRVLKDIEKLTNMDLKPHLVVWHMNKWTYFQELIDIVLTSMGYDYVGRMEDNENSYKFDHEDSAYDCLYRFKENNCDYTTTFKVSEV